MQSWTAKAHLLVVDRGAIRVSPRLLAAARARAPLTLVELALDDPDAVIEHVAAVCRAAVRSVAEELDAPSLEEAEPGSMIPAVADGRILVALINPARYEYCIEMLARGLEQLGLRAHLKLLGRPTPIWDWFDPADAIQARVRLEGARDETFVATWRASEAAMAAAIAAAAEWAGSIEGLRRIVIVVPRLEFEVGREHAEAVLAASVRRAGIRSVSIWGDAGDRVRGAGVSPGGGLLSFVDCVRADANPNWMGAYEAVRARLVAAAPWAVYGFMKRSRQPTMSVLGAMDDWTGPNAESFRLEAQVFETTHVPDAFGVQLLGAQSLARGLAFPPDEWTVKNVEHGATLVETTDPIAWFGAFEPSEQVRRAARATFEPALITPAMVQQAREEWHEVLSRGPVPIDLGAF